MRLETFNIRHGGGVRVANILGSLRRHNPDILLLTEFRNNKRGDEIKSSLSDMGYCYQVNGKAESRINTLLIASKTEFVSAKFFPNLGLHSHRIVSVVFSEFTIIGFYFPGRNEKIAVFKELIKIIEHNKERPTIALGDLNTGKHYLDENGRTFYASEYMDKLEVVSIDAWRKFHGDKKEYTWFSNRGNGFRIDHAFATTPMSKLLTSVEYSHAERINKVSDHSALLIEFTRPSAGPRLRP